MQFEAWNNLPVLIVELHLEGIMLNLQMAKRALSSKKFQLIDMLYSYYSTAIPAVLTVMADHTHTLH